jgi:transcriptional regulator with XRE-family HTH domain
MAISAEEVFRKTMTAEQRAEAADRAATMIAEYKTLRQLRKARALTQAQLAALWGKDQVSISQLEKRSDILMSTLRHYIEAMGGSLSLIVQFEGQTPMLLSGLTETTEDKARK